MPFMNVPDSESFFNRGQFQKVFSAIYNSILAGQGLNVLTGDIGTGKTTICHQLMLALWGKMQILWLADPPSSREELYQVVLRQLGITPPEAVRLFFLEDVQKALAEKMKQGFPCLLVIDECHFITDAVLEAVRILNNLEQDGGKLLQILLVGQKELDTILNRPEHKAFKQRISCHRKLVSLSRDEIREYIRNRLEKAGGALSLFDASAQEVLFSGIDGVPREINNVCHEALLCAHEEGQKQVSAEHVLKAKRNLNLAIVPTLKYAEVSGFSADPVGKQAKSSSKMGRVLVGGLILVLLLVLTSPVDYFVTMWNINRSLIADNAKNSSPQIKRRAVDPVFSQNPPTSVTPLPHDVAPFSPFPPESGTNVEVNDPPVMLQESEPGTIWADEELLGAKDKVQQEEVSRDQREDALTPGQPHHNDQEQGAMYVVQVAAYLAEERALREVSRYQDKLYPALKYTVNYKGKQWEIVGVGSSVDEATALLKMRAFRAKENVDAVVVKIEEKDYRIIAK